MQIVEKKIINDCLFTVGELAEYLNVDRQWIYRNTIKPDGMLHSVVKKIGRHNRYPKSKIDEIFGL